MSTTDAALFPPHSTPNPRHCRIPERPTMDHTTAALQPPTIIGTPFEGGFYAGLFRVGEQLFALIVAPKAGGEFAEVAWHQGSAVVEGATSCFDGMANTAALAEAGSTLAQRVRALDLNGFTDWYLPSRDELELLYRHLKPTKHENWASFRDGDNASSVPAGYPYTKAAPAQTIAEAFREGGPEAFEPAWHWASTQYDAHGAWYQTFANGCQINDDKAYEGRARAVRRFLIT